MHNKKRQAKYLQHICSIIQSLHSIDQHGIEIHEFITSYIGKQSTLCINKNGESYNQK